jgi:phage head maturation protease
VTRVTGYPIVWRVPRVAGARGEIHELVAPSAAQRALTTRSEAYLTLNHDRTLARRLASTRDGTLRLTPDSVGLRVEFAIPRSPVGRELEAAMAAAG